MARQGSLRQGIARSRCSLPALRGGCATILAIFGCLSVTSASAADPTLATGPGAATEIDVRVIFEFQSPSPQPWSLRLRISDAPTLETSLGEIRNFSQSKTTSGIFDLDRSGQMLTIHSRHPIAGGKFELRIRSSREARLWVEPLGQAAEQGNMPPPREIAIVDLLQREVIESQPSPIGAESAAGWSIRRAETDGLRVEDLPPVSVYRPGAPLSLSARVNGMIDHASKSRVLYYELYRVSDGEIVASNRWPIQMDSDGNSQSVELSEAVPDRAGVYELRLQLELDDENIWSRLRRRPPPLLRVTHPIAVLHGDVETEAEQIPWREVGRIRPSEATWSVGQWLPTPSARLIPAASIPAASMPGASIPALAELESDLHAGQSVSLIPPQGMFQATLPVHTEGYPHKVTIRLPATCTAAIRVQVGGSQEQAATSFVLESDATADQQGPWRQHTFLHYPVDHDQIWLTNLDSANPASFDSISVQAGPLYLTTKLQPELTTALTPISSSRTAALRLADVNWTEKLTADVSRRIDFSQCAPSTIALNHLWVAAERIQDYARASGCNGIVIPANSGARSWYESSHYQSQEDPQASRRNHLETLLELLSSSQLRVYVGLNPNMLLTELERTIHEQEVQLVELTRSESTGNTGKSGKSSEASVPDSTGHDRKLYERTQYNPLHPLVQSAIGDLVEELGDRCGRFDGFAGILVDCDGDSHLRPPQSASTDAGSILLFGRANHASASVAQLRSWIQQQGSETFQNWERLQLQRCYGQVGKAAGVSMVRMLMPAFTSAIVSDSVQPATPASNAQDSGPQGSQPEGSVASFRYGPAGVLAKQSLMQQQMAFLAQPLPAVLLGEELADGAPDLVRKEMIGDLCRLMARADPQLLILDNSLVANRLDEDFSGTIRSFCALPDPPLRESLPIDSASHTVRLLSGTIDGHLHVAMISVVPWDTDVDLEMTVPSQWQVVGQADTSLSGQPTQSSGGIRTRVTVPTGQMVVLRSKEPSNTAIRSWTTRVSGGPEAIESIKHKVTLIVERIGILGDFAPYPSLTNGGFEQSGGMGLVGWLHAQHPPGCVQLDDEEFAEGSYSVLLSTITPAVSRTWLVSETIEPPESGRLAVSLACRAEATTDDAPHLLRISIEATRQGDPVRFTRDLEVPSNGQWAQRDVILEADEIDTTSIESLRLTIDSLSGGRVWIDDVQLHDRFPTEKERSELQRHAFLAVQGLQRGNLLPSGKLLQNHWALHLLSLGAIEPSERAIENLPVPAEPPGVAERIRNWLPRPLRF